MEKSGGLILILLFILLSTPGPFAQDIIKDDFKINDDTLAAEQEAPALDIDPLGNFVVVWQDSRNGGPDIFGQRLNPSGEVRGTNFMVNNQMAGDQRYPSVAFDASGSFTVVWQDTREGNRDVYAQMFDASGDTLGSNFKVSDDTGTKPQIEPEADFSAKIIVVWEDERLDVGDVFAQILDRSCIPQDANFKVNDDTNGFSQLRSDVASSAEGYSIVVWQDKREGNYDIYAHRLDSCANSLACNFKVNDDTGTSLQNFPRVASDSAGDFVVVWQDKRNGDEDIYAQFYDSAGIRYGENLRVNDDPGDAYQGHPDVAMDQDGNSVITWVDRRNEERNIYAQRYGSDFKTVGQNFRVNSDAGTAEQSEPAVAFDGDRIYFAWIDTRDGDSDIFAKIVHWEWTDLNEIESENDLLTPALLQNYPNPFNSSTTIRFAVHGKQKTAKSPIPATQKPVNGSRLTANGPIHTTLKICNIQGQLVNTLVDEHLGPGVYQVIWDGTNKKDTEVATGIYFCRLRIEEYVETKKMLLLR